MVSAYTNVDLRHTLGGSPNYFWVTPIRTRRPARGVKVVMVRCGGCKTHVRTRIRSARYTLLARCLWLLMTLVGACGMVVLVAGVANSPPSDLTDGIVLLFWLTMGVLCSAVIAGTIGYYNEGGVRLGWRSGHRLKRGLAATKSRRSSLNR